MSLLRIFLEVVMVAWAIHALWRHRPSKTKQQRARRRAEAASRRDAVRLNAKQRL